MKIVTTGSHGLPQVTRPVRVLTLVMSAAAGALFASQLTEFGLLWLGVWGVGFLASFWALGSVTLAYWAWRNEHWSRLRAEGNGAR